MENEDLAVAMTENPEQAMQRQGATQEQIRKSRSDKGLPRRRSLLLSRAASARFVRVAAALPGGEEELARALEPTIESIFAGTYVSDGSGQAQLEDIALAYQRERMKGGGDEG